MNDKERIERAFANIKAPNNTLEKVYYSANHQKGTRRILYMSLLGTILTGTIVYAVASFGLSSNFFKAESKQYSPEIKESISIIEKNNEKKNIENTYINGFFISSPFKNRNPYTDSEYFHKGIDIIAEKGTEVLAVSDGIVEGAEFNAQYGNHITIKHEDGYETIYAHLQDMSVTEGQKVSVGDVIGTVGATGMATGPHLHFELRYNGEPVNPMDYVKK